MSEAVKLARRQLARTDLVDYLADDLARAAIEQDAELQRVRALLADAQECIADRGQLIADRMDLRAALREALDIADHWIVVAVDSGDADRDASTDTRIAELRRLL